MSEHDDLSRRVALAVGWTEMTPEGGRGEYIMEARWWGVAGVPPSWFSAGDYARPEVPDYEHDADACIAALDATGQKWELRRIYDGYSCAIYRNPLIHQSSDVETTGTTPAVAACHALLAWAKT